MDLAKRAAGHAALSEPGRLRVMDALGVGDRSPSDLVEELGMPSNLLAHHLKVLEAAGLVKRVRSESDRRRTYVRVVPAELNLLIEVPGPPPPGGRVVFVCSANSARSQIAAAVWAAQCGLAASAGTHPAERIHPGTLDVARRHGLRLQAAAPAKVEDVLGPQDTIVTVCDAADREVGIAHIHWSVTDPVPAGDADAFECSFREISDRIDQWLAVPLAANP